MSEPTRQQALAKLSAMSLKIGYPDKWRDYASYQVVRGSYLENLERGSAFEFHRRLAQIGKPVDRTEWDMTPPTVNAYYDAEMNEIVFPAGILQPPFFDPAADEAFNYGGIGAVIGHEMTHGFDDQGSKYDAQGNLRNWWTPEDMKNFQARAACVEKQFDGYVVQDDLHENGKLELGESIADLGGLTLAHMAFEHAQFSKPQAQQTQNIDGFTPDQRFFLGFARIWGTSARPEFERMAVTVDPHPLPRFRVDGPLSNMPEFQKAFSCQGGDAMVRPADQRCKIW
jgi:putative endopeptidase